MLGTASFSTRVVVCLCMLLMCGVFVSAAKAAAPTFQVDDSATLRLAKPAHLRVVDADVPTHELLSSDAALELFQPLASDDAALGYSASTHWLHVRLHNPSTTAVERIVEVDNRLLESIEFYSRDRTGQLTRLSSGDSDAVGQRGIAYARLSLPGLDTADLLVQLKGTASLTAPLLLHRPDAFAERLQSQRFNLGLLIGSIISLAAYNLLLMLALRKATYGWFALHLLTGCLMIAGMHGAGRWLSMAGASQISMFYGALSFAMMGMLLYCSSLLQLRQSWRYAWFLFITLAALRGALAVTALLISTGWLSQLSVAMLLPETLLIVVCCLRKLVHGSSTARLLLAGWALLLPGLATYALVAFGWLPMNPLSSYGPTLGLLVAGVVISFASTLRYESLHRRYETARLIASTGLEKGVAERTRTLAQTMAALNDANQQLRDANDRDGMTGVFNRRYFDQAIVGMLSKSRIARQPFSALVADIDHFKSVNDSAGHLVGDDCIRLVARVLQKAVGAGNTVVRYGGEEFVVLLPGIAANEAIAMAERIRSAVSAETLSTRDKVIRLTISIGIHTAQPNQRVSPTALIRSADQALYAAKGEGRNRVIHADSLSRPVAAI